MSDFEHIRGEITSFWQENLSLHPNKGSSLHYLLIVLLYY
jgi:hypothetical protein